MVSHASIRRTLVGSVGASALGRGYPIWDSREPISGESFVVSCYSFRGLGPPYLRPTYILCEFGLLFVTCVNTGCNVLPVFFPSDMFEYP